MDDQPDNNLHAPAEDDEQIHELEKELEATGKRSLNCSILLILLIIPFLIVLFLISNSSESPQISTKTSTTSNYR